MDTKAAQADLQTTNQNVDNLKNELKSNWIGEDLNFEEGINWLKLLTATNNNLDTKAARIDLAATNNDVSILKGELTVVYCTVNYVASIVYFLQPSRAPILLVKSPPHVET